MSKVFESKEELTDYIGWLLDTDSELESDEGDALVTTHVDPGSNELFIVDTLTRKSYKIVVTEHGVI